jgi:hypothetical protein
MLQGLVPAQLCDGREVKLTLRTGMRNKFSLMKRLRVSTQGVGLQENLFQLIIVCCRAEMNNVVCLQFGYTLRFTPLGFAALVKIAQQRVSDASAL